MQDMKMITSIYIYPVGMRGGPKTIKNVAAREPAKSCEGARSESRRPKRYKNRGFERSRKLSKKVSFCLSGRPVSPKKRRKSRFSIRFGLPRSSSFCTFFRVFAVRPRSENRENVSFLRVSRPGPVLGRFVFCRKTGCPKKCEKCLRPKKRCAIIVLEPSFGPFLAHRFRGWVFLRCGARFWAPITREKCHFWTSWSGPKRPPLTFLERSPCGPAWVRAEKDALPAVARTLAGNGRDASQNSTSLDKNPMETADRSVFGLIDCNNTDDDKVRDIKRAPKNCVLAAVSCVEADIRSFSLRFGEVALFSSLLGDLLQFGAGLSACLGFIMAPFGSFSLLLLLCVTMAGQIQPSPLPTGPATVLSRKCVWDCRGYSDPPLSRNRAPKTNGNKTKTKGMHPFCWKPNKNAVGFVVVWILRELWAADASKCPRAYGKKASSGQKFGCATYTRFFKTSFGQQNTKYPPCWQRILFFVPPLFFVPCSVSFFLSFLLFDFLFFGFWFFFCSSLPFSCFFHSVSSLPFPSNFEKKTTSRRTKTVNKSKKKNRRGARQACCCYCC